MKKFNKNKSVLKNVYAEFSVNDPGELDDIFMREDQKLMKESLWDYNNNDLITNKIKDMIEEVGVSSIKDEKERRWIKNILWMWYHHAISCALWKYGDKEMAKKYSSKALKMQNSDNPNKITRLLYLLIRDDINSAVWLVKKITENPEKTTAKHILKLYKKGDFYKPQN